jgi:hypothetical protein
MVWSPNGWGASEILDERVPTDAESVVLLASELLPLACFCFRFSVIFVIFLICGNEHREIRVVPFKQLRHFFNCAISAAVPFLQLCQMEKRQTAIVGEWRLVANALKLGFAMMDLFERNNCRLVHAAEQFALQGDTAKKLKSLQLMRDRVKRYVEQRNMTNCASCAYCLRVTCVCLACDLRVPCV